MMLALLDWVYGPSGYGDPYYLLMRDFIVLMPAWYGYFWVTVIVGFFGFRMLRKAALRQAARRGTHRVQSRTARILARQRSRNALRLARRFATNDNRGGESLEAATG